MPRAKLGMKVRKDPYEDISEKMLKGAREEERLEAKGRKMLDSYHARSQGRIKRVEPSSIVTPRNRRRST